MAKISWVVFLIAAFIGGYSIAVNAKQSIQDPTRPPFVLKEGLRSSKYGIVVSSILVSPQRSWALVNGEFLTLGDMVGAMKIVAIQSERVIFKGIGGEIAVPLIEQTIKQHDSEVVYK